MNIDTIEKIITSAVNHDRPKILRHALDKIKSDRELLNNALDVTEVNGKKVLRGMNTVYYHINDGLDGNHNFEMWDNELETKFMDNVLYFRDIYTHNFKVFKGFDKSFLTMITNKLNLKLSEEHLDILINEALLNNLESSASRLSDYESSCLRYFLLINKSISESTKLSVAGTYTYEDIMYFEKTIQASLEEELGIKLKHPLLVYLIDFNKGIDKKLNLPGLKTCMAGIDFLYYLQSYRSILRKIDLGSELTLRELEKAYQEKQKRINGNDKEVTAKTTDKTEEIPPIVNSRWMNLGLPGRFPQFIYFEPNKSIDLMKLPKRIKEFVSKHLKRQTTIEK